jgi:cobalt-zinc-cadmium efflux system protein
LVLAALVLAVELAGALVGRSVALLADAGHIGADALSLLLAYLAARQAQKAPTPQRSFGYHRATILAALMNALVLVLLSLALGWAAVGRLVHPVFPQPGWMGGTALVAFLLNVLIASRLLPHRHDLSARSVLLHYLGDAAASLGVAAAAAAAALFHVAWVDPAVSLAIAAAILAGGIPLVRRTVDILMEGTPSDLDPEEVALAIAGSPGIQGVHDLHIWNLGEHQRLLTCHVLVEDMQVRESRELLERLARTLRQRYGIEHATFQVEAQGSCPEDHDCALGQDVRPKAARAAGSRRSSGR